MHALKVSLMPVVDSDFEELADLRLAAMRESLERVGRFDPIRARERLRTNFSPAHTRFMVFEGERIGFFTVRPTAEGMRLDHFYVHPAFQNRGIGGAILKTVFAEADALGLAVFVGALKESASNRFYQRHGFTLVGEGDWDNYYSRPASAGT